MLNNSLKPLVLFLDDDVRRIEEFTKRVRGQAEVIAVTTAADAIRKLKEYAFVQVFLDHDLGGKIYVDSDEAETGAEVCRWLATHELAEQHKEAEFILHTMNPVGATVMYSILKEAGFSTVRPIPFHTLLEIIR